ncbi:MAG: outer membrane lipoprotein carrier protein LolA [Phaeodactylibacter sp.]|nr:outer membrane lipoprotein carrier protein LolA [Phaeodactylibacter sp.]
MKQLLPFLFLALVSLGPLIAQEHSDAEAIAYLERLNAKSADYQTLAFDFELRIRNTASALDLSQKGSVKMKGNRFFMEMGEVVLIAEEEALYTIRPKDCEAIINDRQEEEFGQNLLHLFSIDIDQHLHRLVEETTLDGKAVVIIQSFPKHVEKSSYVSITWTIDRDTMEPYLLSIRGRDGTLQDYNIQNLVVNPPLADSLFKFVSSAFPCMEEIVDLREN